MKPNSYKIISDCVENGINGGWNKAHKHTDNPSEDFIKEQIGNYIMNQICEYFKFDEPEIETNTI